MKISKELQIGMNALTLIKKSEAPIKTDDLADKVGTTPGFLGQVMKQLRKSELVYSKQGPGGGYIYNHGRTETTALDIAVALGYDINFVVNRESPTGHLEAEILNALSKTKI